MEEKGQREIHSRGGEKKKEGERYRVRESICRDVHRHYGGLGLPPSQYFCVPGRYQYN